MEQKIKFIFFGLVFLLAISLLVIFNIQNSRLSLLKEYQATKQRLTEENAALASKLNNVTSENKSLQGRLEMIQTELDNASKSKAQLQRRYELVNKEREDLLARLESYQAIQQDLLSYEDENKSLKNKIDDLLDLQDEINQLRQENKRLKERVEEAKQLLKKKAAGLSYVKVAESELGQEPAGKPEVAKEQISAVDLPPIVVSPSSVVPASNLSFELLGRIINVNEEYNFVVINLGQSGGVQAGMVFDVLRNNWLLGKIRVIKTRLDIAACDIVQAETSFKRGDSVRYAVGDF